ncbi:MAG TPA: hypothetical protein VFS04_12715 [Alphaproteobacteria bacterium]|nr:hypothetical protein [Alphaproteobacteria bacterium]
MPRLLTRLFLCLMLAAPLVILGAAPAAWAQSRPAGFLSVIDDVPLMPGLSERMDAAVVFDKPEGRIVEAEATGRLTRADVLKFYASSLPQLGWRARGEGKFLRDREELVLSFVSGSGGSLTVRFTLSPDR